jgi:integrase/recombinase XerD
MNDEIRRVISCFDGTFAVRNRCLFILGVSTGGRISELLGLRLTDVYQNNSPVSDLLFDRSIVKGKETSRAVPLNSDGILAVEEIIMWHQEQYGKPLKKLRPLFPSRNGQGTLPMSRKSAHLILKDAFNKAGLNGKLATHSMRKSYAQRLYEQTNDIYSVREMLGHIDVKTTQKYLGVNYSRLRQASEAMSVMSETPKGYASTSVESAADEILFGELVRRGYDPGELVGE